jgi:glucose-6-phosphate 1-dehydrogenase
MLFWRQDGVERSWSFITPIIDRCEDCGDQQVMLEFYQAGSAGPAAVSKLVGIGGEV